MIFRKGKSKWQMIKYGWVPYICNSSIIEEKLDFELFLKNLKNFSITRIDFEIFIFSRIISNMITNIGNPVMGRAHESINSKLRIPLGKLVDTYVANKSSFGNCVPKRHEEMFKLVNEYRIVSAHPKQFEVKRETADAIFNLVLTYLLDPECELPKRRGRPKKP